MGGDDKCWSKLGDEVQRQGERQCTNNEWPASTKRGIEEKRGGSYQAC